MKEHSIDISIKLDESMATDDIAELAPFMEDLSKQVAAVAEQRPQEKRKIIEGAKADLITQLTVVSTAATVLSAILTAVALSKGSSKRRNVTVRGPYLNLEL